MSENKQALQVAALKNGTVIDHIPSEKLFTVVSLLGLEHMTTNITIGDYEVVEKKEVRMPDELKAIVKCANPKCITNNEPMATLFHVIDKDNCVIKCHYCEKEQKREDITII